MEGPGSVQNNDEYGCLNPYVLGDPDPQHRRKKIHYPRWLQSSNPGKGKIIFSGPKRKLCTGSWRVQCSPFGKVTEMLLFQFALLLLWFNYFSKLIY
jgi:hypothetical protein